MIILILILIIQGDCSYFNQPVLEDCTGYTHNSTLNIGTCFTKFRLVLEFIRNITDSKIGTPATQIFFFL